MQWVRAMPPDESAELFNFCRREWGPHRAVELCGKRILRSCSIRRAAGG